MIPLNSVKGINARGHHFEVFVIFGAVVMHASLLPSALVLAERSNYIPLS